MGEVRKFTRFSGERMTHSPYVGFPPLGSNVNQIPAASLASVWLDGTIVDVAGSKYFVDKKGGANILITGYDFPTGWVKGFPYKSAATIDIFGQTGVPVVSLFQNIDYGNQYFTRHVAQVVDGNGVETSEAYVADIVAYSEALTGDDLTEANTYYGVPAEITTNVRWIDWNNGNNANAGTKAAPWKTFDKANTSATAGDTIYCKQGVYDENSPSLAGSLYLTKSLTYIGLGRVEIQSTGANYVIFLSSGDITFKGLIINAEDAKNTCINVYNVGNKLTRWEKCCFTRGNTTIYNGQSVETVGFKHCLFLGKSASATQTFATWSDYVDTCLQRDIAFSIQRDGVYKNSRVSQNNKAYIIRINNVALNACGNYFNYSGEGIIENTAHTSAKAINIFNNTFIQGDSALTRISAIHQSGTATCTIYNNTFSSTIGNYSATNQYFISLENCPTPNIHHNIFASTTNKSLTHIGILVTTVDVVAKINNNYSISRSLSGTQISLGYEGTVTNRTNGSEFIGNRVIGFKFGTPSEASSTVHAVLLNCGINIDIKYNHISHSTLGLVVKTGGQAAYTAAGIQYNLFEDCGTSIYIRGVSGINVFNNTIKYGNATYGQAFANGIFADENSAMAGNQYSENVIAKNNIIDVKVAVGNLIQFDAHAVANGCICEDSILLGGQYLYTAGSFTDLATAQADGKLLNCSIGDALLSTELIPTTTINGADLGSDYDAGLDVLTSFGSTSTLPVIVTKDQIATWQMGAYVQ